MCDKPDREIPGREVIEIAIAARDCEADSQDVRRLIKQYCWKLENGQDVSNEQAFVLEAFARFLDPENSVTLDKAFGLVKGRGAPAGRSADRDLDIAISVLKEYLRGETVEQACESASGRHYVSEGTVKRAWKDYKHEALIHVRAERSDPISKSELLRLTKIFPEFKGERKTKDENWIYVLLEKHKGK